MNEQKKIIFYAYMFVLAVSFIYGIVARVGPGGYVNYNDTTEWFLKECPYGGTEIFNRSTEVVCGGLNPRKYNGSHEKGYVDLDIDIYR